MKRQRCARCESRHATMFAFYKGESVYACRRHWPEIRKDQVTEWMYLPRFFPEGGMTKESFRIWLVEGKFQEDWTPVFHFGKSNEDNPRIVWCRYETKEQAQAAADYMQANNDANTDPENPAVRYRVARYERVMY